MPNRVLDESRKNLWVGRIVLSGVDPLSDLGQDSRTAARAIASGAISMLRPEPSQDPSANQEIVNQAIDRDHVDADYQPMRRAARAA